MIKLDVRQKMEHIARVLFFWPDALNVFVPKNVDVLCGDGRDSLSDHLVSLA